MARPREPIDLVIAKGKKNLTKAEIADRRASEIQPSQDEIVAPSFLTAAQKKKFVKLAGQLQKIRIMGETDCEALARYIIAQDHYERAVKDQRRVYKQQPKDGDVEEMTAWLDMAEKVDKRMDRFFKQANATARDLGLTISSRCKLQVPIKEEEPKENKFAKFGKAAGSA